MAEAKRKKLVPNETASRILLRPRMTEKAHSVISLGKYVFQVAPRATKSSVKESIERLYDVKVTRVNMVRIPKKRRVFGRVVGWKSSLKKAIVTLKEGESIELFKGV